MKKEKESSSEMEDELRPETGSLSLAAQARRHALASQTIVTQSVFEKYL